jgi:hypothetical protein
VDDSKREEEWDMRRTTLIAVCLLVVVAAASCSGTATVAVENMHNMITLQFPTTNNIYPQVQVTVNGEAKYLGNYFNSDPYYDEWEIDWFGFKLREEVVVRASIYEPGKVSNGGLYETSFQVGDGDMKMVVVSQCPGWAE